MSVQIALREEFVLAEQARLQRQGTARKGNEAGEFFAFDSINQPVN